MALSYEEYKELNSIGLAAAKAAVDTYNNEGAVIDMMTAQVINERAISACSFWAEDRVGDMISVKGFLGFMMMVQSYPEEFAEDKQFWVECYATCTALLDAMAAGEDPLVHTVITNDPEYVMGRRFVINPNSIIRG